MIFILRAGSRRFEPPVCIVAKSTHLHISAKSLPMKRTLILLLSTLVLAATFGSGCERTPEDVEKWRNAQNGEEKMLEWLKSPQEPMPVRQKTIQVLIEEEAVNKVGMALDDIEEDADRKALVEAAVPTVVALWEADDFPDITEENRKKGGISLEGPYKQVTAKDAAYFLHPHAEGENQKKLESIIAGWMAEDWDVRNKQGSTDIGQLTERAGEQGMQGLIAWIKEGRNPQTPADFVKKYGSDDAKKLAAETLAQLTDAALPDIPKPLRAAVLTFDHEALLPVLKKAAKDPKTEPGMIDGSMEAILRIQGPASTGFFTEVVKTQSGLLRLVAAQRLLESRLGDGFINAAFALPIEMDTYPTGKEAEQGAFKKSTQILCNAFKTELEDAEDASVEDALPKIERVLNSDRWPAQVVGLQCVRVFKADKLADAVQALTRERQKIPAWGEDNFRVRDLARDVLSSL